MLKKCLQILVIALAITASGHTKSFSDVMPYDIDVGYENRHFVTELRQGIWKNVIQPTLVPLHVAADFSSFMIEKSKPVAVLRLGTIAGMITLPEYQNPLSLLALMVHFHADYNLSVSHPDSPHNSYYQTLDLISGGYLLADYYYKISPFLIRRAQRFKDAILVPVDDNSDEE